MGLINFPFCKTGYTVSTHLLDIVGHIKTMLVMSLPPPKKVEGLSLPNVHLDNHGICNSEYQPYYSRHLTEAESTSLGVFQSGVGRCQETGCNGDSRMGLDKPRLATSFQPINSFLHSCLSQSSLPRGFQQRNKIPPKPRF